jgi:hypothetical protein
MVATLIGVIVEAADASAAEFSEKYSDADIGLNELSDGV